MIRVTKGIETNQASNQDDQGKHHPRIQSRVDVGHRQQKHRGTADQGQQDLDFHKTRSEIALKALRQPRTHTHRTHKQTDGERELCDAVAKQMSNSRH